MNLQMNSVPSAAPILFIMEEGKEKGKPLLKFAHLIFDKQIYSIFNIDKCETGNST